MNCFDEDMTVDEYHSRILILQKNIPAHHWHSHVSRTRYNDVKYPVTIAWNLYTAEVNTFYNLTWGFPDDTTK